MKVGEWVSSWLCRETGVRFPKGECESERASLRSTVQLR